MKKVLAAILILTIFVCFAGCGGSNDVKATVTTNNGETLLLSAKELEDIKEENEISFKNNYWCASVTVEGKIKEIKSSCIINGTHYDWVVVIEGGKSDWFIGKTSVSKTTVTEVLLASLSIGDSVRATGEIVGASMGKCDISNGTTSIKKIG